MKPGDESTYIPSYTDMSLLLAIPKLVEKLALYILEKNLDNSLYSVRSILQHRKFTKRQTS